MKRTRMKKKRKSVVRMRRKKMPNRTRRLKRMKISRRS